MLTFNKKCSKIKNVIFKTLNERNIFMGIFSDIGGVVGQLNEIKSKAQQMSAEEIAEASSSVSVQAQKDLYLKILKQRVEKMDKIRAMNFKKYLDNHFYLTYAINATAPLLRAKGIDIDDVSTCDVKIVR